MSLLRSRRFRIFAWALTSVALAGLLFWAYRRYVLLHPDPTLTWERAGVKYELLNPKMLGALLLAPWFIGVLAGSLADLPLPQRALSVLLRLTFVALIALGLSRLARTATTEKVATIYLIDVSDSVTDESLDDARAALARREFDLIVTDLRLGGKRDGGLQVMAASGLLSPDATVIVLTAYPDPDNRHASLRLGATHFLEKPVDLGTIAALAAQAGVSSALIPVAARRPVAGDGAATPLPALS